MMNLSIPLHAQSYLEKFQKYIYWSTHLPTQPDPEFIEFINKKTPLSQKLRGQWLYQLALKKDWGEFLKYYQPSNDISLQCYEQMARINLGQTTLALPRAKALWLQNTTQPPSCDNVFKWLLTTQDPTQSLVTQRIQLALEHQNQSLAVYLLKRFKPPRLVEARLLESIHQQPRRIMSLTSGPLHGDFFLYGLKRLVPHHMEEAIHDWEEPKARQLMNQAQSQSFLNFLVIYKAMRNHKDTVQWFMKIKPQYYTDLLLEWRIRYALKHQQWRVVTQLIPKISQHEEPCWKYWLARASQAQGLTDKARLIYQSLAKTRSYYGFLASLRLKTHFSFHNESVQQQKQRLRIYRPITEQVKKLYQSHHVVEAARLVNDFTSELPKDDKSAFVQWLAEDLKWYAKAIDVSNAEELSNQLSLRFPLPHYSQVHQSSAQYQIPPEFIYAVIRQESGFKNDALSPAGAHGLMQLMPQTAKIMAKEQKIAFKNNQQLFFVEQNIKIGTAYLHQLAKRFHNHPILMAAAYNAGPTQVNHWLHDQSPSAIDIWIESLPWRETRNYLKNIIAFYAVYQYRINQKSDIAWFMNTFSKTG